MARVGRSERGMQRPGNAIQPPRWRFVAATPPDGGRPSGRPYDDRVDRPNVREIFDKIVERGCRGFRLEMAGREGGSPVRDATGRVKPQNGLLGGQHKE